MMDENSFDELITLLEKDSSLEAAECLRQINLGKIIFNPAFEISALHALDTYKTRYDIQREVTQATVTGYENLLRNLEIETGKNVKIYTLTDTDSTRFIFSDERAEKILGILNSPYNGFSQRRELYKDYKSKGLEVRGIIYDKKVRQKDEW